MQKNKFKEFLSAFNMDRNLHEAILNGYNLVFESINSWGPDLTPIELFTNPVGEPMGSYQNIMKQLPSPIGGFGNAPDAGSNYNVATAGCTRDINEETREQWGKKPEFPKIKTAPSNTTKRIIKKAQEHIPTGTEQGIDQLGYHTNAHLGVYDLDSENNGMGIPSM